MNARMGGPGLTAAARPVRGVGWLAHLGPMGGRPGASQKEAPMNDSVPASLSAIRFLKVTEVATLLRVSRMSVYRLIHSGELEAVRFGRNFRVPEHAVDAYLRQSFYDAG